MTNPTRLWVHPNFRKTLKKMSAEQERSVIDLTQDLAIDLDNNPMVRRIKRAFK